MGLSRTEVDLTVHFMTDTQPIGAGGETGSYVKRYSRIASTYESNVLLGFKL